ncbi:MAG: hypothetical protein HWE27_08475 [Gammaproteobacteria bacterium]|nr:hypothetical protein [Gammaproteobacteria bacterium]
MPALNLDDLVLLLHTEVATAAKSAAVEGRFEQLKLSSIRVRMGHKPTTSDSKVIIDDSETEPESNVALDPQRYPLAESGWLLDITYQATDEAKAEKDEQSEQYWSSSKAREFFSKQPVIWVSGVGRQFSKLLSKQGIETIGQFSSLSREKLKELFATHLTKIRQLQSMARLALATTPVAINKSLVNWYLRDLIAKDDKSIQESTRYSQDQIKQLSAWIQQLELALDDTVFSKLTFKSLGMI